MREKNFEQILAENPPRIKEKGRGNQEVTDLCIKVHLSKKISYMYDVLLQKTVI